MPRRYAELQPDALSKLWGEDAPAVLPLGALEWHGPHLPLGLDLLVAEAFAERLADAMGGVLLPALVTPVTTLPHAMSLQVRTEAFRMILDDTLAGLHRSGARRVALVSGHYAQGHEIEMYEAAMRAMDDHEGLLVFAAAPLEPLGDDTLLDHAGRIETSLLLSLRPDLVHLDALGTPAPRENAVLGEDPHLSTAEEGHRLFDRALARWSEWLGGSNQAALESFYDSRFDAYQPYVEAYHQGSWEEAITKWWEEKGRGLREEG